MTKHDRHIFLYAKGHYKNNDRINNMKKILAERNGVDAEFISNNDIIDVLTTIVWRYINTDSQFSEFIKHLNPDNSWMIGCPTAAFYIRLINVYLSILRWQKVEDIPFELGKADPNLLPLSLNTLKMNLVE